MATSPLNPLMDSLTASYERHRSMKALTAAATRKAESLWAQVDPQDIAATWRAVEGEAFAATSLAQIAAAQGAEPYVEAAWAQVEGADAGAVGSVNARRLGGIASDGRSLVSLLREPPIQSLTAIARGATTDEAMFAGLASLTRIVGTQIADAGRAGESVAITSRPRIAGFVRMLVPPSCSRCAVLAGKFYRWNEGFQRHPLCFPAGVVTSGPATRAASRRWYEGELVIIHTASGKKLPATGNHPVLTDQGWVPANLLVVGDQVVRSLKPEGAVPLMVPDEQHRPSLIEDEWRSLGVATLRGVPTTAEDFHGDGGHGEVDVVLSDRALWDRMEAARDQRIAQESLSIGAALPAILDRLSAREQAAVEMRAAGGIVGGGSLLLPFLRGHLRGADLTSGGSVADLDALLDESRADRFPADPVAEAEAVLALTREVFRRQSGSIEREFTARWDAPAAPFAVESRGAYAEVGEDLRLRLADQVATDRVVELERVQWSGHVYNLTSAEGWFSANGLIVSNCDCRHVPSSEQVAGDLTTSPRTYFDSLTAADQDRYFTQSGAQAIRDGADISQVVNARRRGLFDNAAGTTAEGNRRTYAQRKGELPGAERRKIGRAGQAMQDSAATGPRLMPEAIYEIAESRTEAIALLRQYGYLI